MQLSLQSIVHSFSFSPYTNFVFSVLNLPHISYIIFMTSNLGNQIHIDIHFFLNGVFFRDEKIRKPSVSDTTGRVRMDLFDITHQLTDHWWDCTKGEQAGLMYFSSTQIKTSTEKYAKVSRSTQKYEKYREVPKKYEEVPRSVLSLHWVHTSNQGSRWFSGLRVAKNSQTVRRRLSVRQ